MAGSIGAVEVPGTIKGGEEGAEDRAESAPSATGGDGGVATESVIRLDFKAEPGAGGGNAKNDTSSSFALTFSQPGGRPVKPFGSEHFEPKFTNPSWKFEGSKPQKCMLAATLEINCPWGTASGGRTDVPSATDAIVTKDSYKEIRDDLKPGASSPFKSRRAKYYSQSLVERHEKFHGTDDWAWAQGAGHELVNAKVKATRIDPRNTAAAVNKLLADCLSLLKSENWKFYAGGGGSHDSYAGEIRAYGDGKPHYQALAEAVEKHGQSLEASAPRDDGKKGNEK